MDGRNILQRILKKECEGVHWIQLAEDNTVADLVNTAKNLRVP